MKPRIRKRRPYRGSRAFDKSCRCHGGCPWCYGNRMKASVVQMAKAPLTDEQMDHKRQDRLALNQMRLAVAELQAAKVEPEKPVPLSPQAVEYLKAAVGCVIC